MGAAGRMVTDLVSGSAVRHCIPAPPGVMRREDGQPRCVSCLLCVTVCPSECISIEAAEDPDPEIQKVPARFVVDLSRCCFCGFCVEACPEDAIRMDTDRIEIAAYRRPDLIYDLDRLLK